MNHELEPIGRTILLPGVSKATRVGLQFLGGVTELEMTALDYTIQTCDKSVSWWMGDVVCKLIDLALDKEKAADSKHAGKFRTPEERRGYMSSFAREYAVARGLGQGTVLDRTLVANYFPLSTRVTELEWTHHREVFGFVGHKGLEHALTWLARAAAGDGDGDGQRWSVARLREELNKASVIKALKEPAAPPTLAREVSQFESWSAMHFGDVEVLAPDLARWMLDQIPNTIAFVDRLRARVGQPAPRDGQL